MLRPRWKDIMRLGSPIKERPMPLFRPKRACPNCGSEVKEPRDAADYLCPNCKKPGPWATTEQRADWEKDEAVFAHRRHTALLY